MKIDMLGSFNESEKLTGPEKVSKRLFSEFTKYHDVRFYQYFDDGSQYSIWQKLFGRTNTQVQVIRIGIFRICMEWFKKQPDIILISQFERFAIMAIIQKIFFRIPVVYVVNGIVRYEDQLHSDRIHLFLKIKNIVIEHIFFLFSNHIVFVSNTTYKQAKQYYFSDQKYTVIYNGTDVRCFDGKNKNHVISLVTVADEDRPEKGTKLLNQLADKLPNNINLTIIGNYKSLENKYQNITIHEKLETEDYFKLLTRSQFYLLTSCYEPFSISALESMSLGLIPVVSDVSGISELIIPNKNGFIFKSNNLIELEKIMESIQKLSPNQIGELAHRAQETATSFTWEKVSDRYMNMFEKLVK